MKVYINYPNPHIQIHCDESCALIRMQRKANQRVIAVTIQTMPQVLTEFIRQQHNFAANTAENDMWLDIRLVSVEQEEGFVYVVQALLGLHHRPLGNSALVKVHCT